MPRIDAGTEIKCEKCGANMVLRKGKYGQFYGCGSFPKCRNTKPFNGDERPAEVKTNNNIEWSEYQKAIFALAADFTTWQHLVIEAGAGSGKTTVGVEFASRLPPGLEIAFMAFNTKIAGTFASRLPSNVDASTLHSRGLGNATNALGKVKVEGRKVFYIIRDLTDRMPWDIAEKVDQSVSSIIKLVSLCKANLMDPTNANLDFICDRWNVEVNGDRELIYDVTREAYKLSIEDTKTVDFDDMIHMTATGRVPAKQYDILVIDETQDLNKANLEFVIRSIKPDGHIVAVGDANQSIYGFRGADTDAMPNIIARLNAKVLPLSITYRVPKSGVALANTLVPELQAAPNAKEGILESVSEYRFLDMVQSGDLVLCRTNAPLVKPCFDLIRQGRKAVILGRDIGSGLIALVQKIQKREQVRALGDTMEALNEYRRQEISKLVKSGKEMAADNLDDKVETIFALSDGCHTVADLERRIKDVFRDDAEGVTFSTVHKSKGGEADRVFILNPGLMPHPKATAEWELAQEYNIMYVAYTRHKEALYFVGAMPLFEVPDPNNDETVLDSEFGCPNCGDPSSITTTDEDAELPQGDFKCRKCGHEWNPLGEELYQIDNPERIPTGDPMAPQQAFVSNPDYRAGDFGIGAVFQYFPPQGRFEDNIYRPSARELAEALPDYMPTIIKDELVLLKEIAPGAVAHVWTSIKVGQIAGGTGDDSIRVTRQDDEKFWFKAKACWIARTVPQDVRTNEAGAAHLAEKIRQNVAGMTGTCKCGGVTIKCNTKVSGRYWWKCENGCRN